MKCGWAICFSTRNKRCLHPEILPAAVVQCVHESVSSPPAGGQLAFTQPLLRTALKGWIDLSNEELRTALEIDTDIAHLRIGCRFCRILKRCFQRRRKSKTSCMLK